MSRSEFKDASSEKDLIANEFMDSVKSGRVEIIANDQFFVPRLQTSSLDERTIIFTQRRFNGDWENYKQSNTIWNLMVDTVIHLRKLSGPSMYKIAELKVNE